jgi:hypothetical protein
MCIAQALPARCRVGLLPTICALVALWPALAPSPAAAATVKPGVELGPVVVLNGHATVVGHVRGLSPTVAALWINGHPIGLNAQGAFVAVVDLSGHSALVLEVVDTFTGRRSAVSIPLYTGLFGLGGLLHPDVLGKVERAAVQLLEPLGGFRIIDGRPLEVAGLIGGKDGLVNVSVNGVNVLGLLDQSGRFSIPIAGTSRSITIVIVDNRGVASTTTQPVEHQTTPPAGAPAARSAKGPGLRIASIRYVTKNFRRTKRVQMIVTVKNSLGRVVRGARVQVRAASPRGLRFKPKVKWTGKRGRVVFLLHPRTRVFGKRVAIVTVARTPAARAQRKTTVRVPKLRQRTLTAKRG